MFSIGYTPVKFCKDLCTVWEHVRYTQYTNSIRRTTIHDPLPYNNSDTNSIRITTTHIPPYFIWLSWWQKNKCKKYTYVSVNLQYTYICNTSLTAKKCLFLYLPIGYTCHVYMYIYI